MAFYEGHYPMIWEKRDVGVEVVEQIVVINNRSELSEIPSKFERVTITGYSEVDEGVTPSQGQYSVDYKNGIVTFGGQVEDNTVLEARYMGMGVVMYPARRIYIRDKNTEVYKNLQQIFEEATKGGVMSVQGKTGSVTLLPSDIGAVDKQGDTMIGRLFIDGSSVDPRIDSVNATDPISNYPEGLSFQIMNNSETGFPSVSGVLMTYNGGETRNFQLFQTKNTQDFYVRTYHDANGWTEWAKLLHDKNMGSGSLIDADLLDGKDSTYFEQLVSDHTNRTDNPHNVVASQIAIDDVNSHFVSTTVEGALDEEASARKAHEQRTDNPHNVTAAQVGAFPAENIAMGSATFSGNSTATTVPHGLGVIPTSVSITPTENPGGNLGEVWVTKDEANIYVYNSGTAVTAFDWIAIK